MISPFAYTKPIVPEATPGQRAVAFSYCRNGFTFEWQRRENAHHFSLSNVFTNASRTEARYLCDFISNHLRNVASLADGKEPVLAYVCSDDEGMSSGITEVRGALEERLGWKSVLVRPEQRLLRNRVCGVRSVKEAGELLISRSPILLADTSCTGAAIAQAAGVMAAFGAQTLAAVVVYDPQQGAEESLATIRLPLYAVFNRADSERGNDQLERRIKASVQPHHVSDLSAVARLAAA